MNLLKLKEKSNTFYINKEDRHRHINIVASMECLFTFAQNKVIPEHIREKLLRARKLVMEASTELCDLLGREYKRAINNDSKAGEVAFLYDQDPKTKSALKLAEQHECVRKIVDEVLISKCFDCKKEKTYKRCDYYKGLDLLEKHEDAVGDVCPFKLM